MSYQSFLIKFSYKMTPKQVVFWVVNNQLKGIAKLLDYDVDFDGRKIHSKVHLEGEEEAIEVRLEDFTLLKYEDHFTFAVQQVHSNKPWLNTALTRFIMDQEIKIPNNYVQLVKDLFSFEFHDSEEEQ